MKHRRHRRVVAKGVAAQVDSDTRLGECSIDNISVGGLFMRTATAMPIGMSVRVDLTKPGLASPLQISGRVVSCVSAKEALKQGIPRGVGIEFDELPLATEKQLRTLLRALGLTDLAEPTEIEPDTLYATTTPDAAQATTNMQGLMTMLSDALQRLKDRDLEIAKLRAEIKKLKAAR